jgi:hypothetical protein
MFLVGVYSLPVFAHTAYHTLGDSLMVMIASGKFISLQFSPDLSYTLIGAFVTTYLLEKTRVCYQVQKCRNVLIFFFFLLFALFGCLKEVAK